MKENKYTSWKAHNAGEANRTRVYQFVCEFIKINGYAPSIVEIGEGVGLSKTSVHRHLGKLIDNGMLETDWSKPARRNIQIPKGAM